jgi:hypothetical protein
MKDVKIKHWKALDFVVNINLKKYSREYVRKKIINKRNINPV